MAEQQFCTFYLDDHFFGIEVENVQEVLRHQAMTRVPLAPVLIGGLINLRGQIVTAIDLRQRLGLPQVSEEAFEPPPDTLHADARELVRGVYKLPRQLLHVLALGKAVAVSGPGNKVGQAVQV
jgi:purine-binding chemotaxis protein CheW